MPDIVVSAHGGRWSTERPSLKVPATSKVRFDVKDGELLPNARGYEILDELKAGKVPAGAIVQEVDGGSSTFDYSCWYASEFADDCGIYEVGTGKLLLDLSEYTEDEPLLLSEILERFSDCTVYWDACREVSEGEGFPAQAEADAFPGARPVGQEATRSR